MLIQYITAAAVVALAAAIYAYRSRSHVGSPILTPLKAPKLTALPEFDTDYKDQMLWGSYRSGLYFGMRTRTPKGLVVGLLWFDPDDPATLQQMRVRHEASQGDALSSYGWTRHDGRSYGSQQLVDGEYNISLAMLKSDSRPGAGPGGDWALRLGLGRTAGVPAKRRRISVVLYVGDEDTPRAPWKVLPGGEVAHLRPGAPDTLLAGGSSALAARGAGGGGLGGALGGAFGGALGKALGGLAPGAGGKGRWALHAQESTPGSPRARGCRLDYLSLSLEGQGGGEGGEGGGGKEHLLRVRDYMLSTMYERLERQPSSARFHLYLPNGATAGSDLAMFQLTCSMPCQLDFAFTSGDGSASPEAAAPLLGEPLTRALAEKEREFDERFERVFGAGLRRERLLGQAAASSEGGEDAAPSPSPSPAPYDDAALLAVSRAALANLLGSAGYFFGSSLVRAGGPGSDPAPYPAAGAPLYTCTPSRSFFPRGFLWDEGFHQLLVQRWDPQLSRDMISHWLDLLNSQGWIPREQILGPEARARVPPEFVVQDPAAANPPSLFLPIAHMAAQLRAAREAGRADADPEHARAAAFLRAAWPRLAAWYAWFQDSQAGDAPGSYRWRGRDPAAAAELNPKTLTSGLDDFPRSSHPDGGERHLDLRCWMALAARAMTDIGAALDLPAAAVAPYAAAAAALADTGPLLGLHWDGARGAFADWGTHTEDVQLAVKTVAVPGAPGQPPQARQVSERVTRGSPRPQYVPQFGYVSLFPLIMKLLPTGSEEASAAAATSQQPDNVTGAELTLQQIAMLRNPGLLWSDHGLRSLARTASLYKARNTADDPPYWRGQIWININYLVLRALSHYAAAGNAEVRAAAAAAHDELRRRLLTTLVNGYVRQGYLYEQYDDDSGRGTSSHPFTGWTALVTLIAAQEY